MSQNTKTQEQWNKSDNHCIDCGKLIHPEAQRCKSCDTKYRWQIHNMGVGGRKRELPRNCIDCGKECTPGCKRCKSCATKERWRCGNLREIYSHFKGENHPSWKGGRCKGSKGYISVYRPDHPRSDKRGRVLEHILVWETTQNKPLPEGWVIHHLNGIRDDNQPQNLKGLPDKKHKWILQAKAKRIQELEALLNGQAQLL